MRRLIIPLTVCAFLLAPLPAVAQSASEAPAAKAQQVELPRKVRILVQRGLAALGFDPGPADGLFARKTREAIWNWQKAKGLDTTGYLTQAEAEALAAVGAEAGGKPGREAGSPGKRRRGGREARTHQSPGMPRNRILYTPRCGAQKAPGGCWRELSSPANCNVWVNWYHPKRGSHARGETVTWSGECARERSVLDGLAHGRGTLKAGDWSMTGEYVNGKRHGRWVIQFPRGDVSAGPYVDGKLHGRWVQRGFGGGVIERSYVDGKIHGRFVMRRPDGSVGSEGPYVDGKRHGRWVIRYSRSHVDEGPYVDDKRHGRWVERYPDGDVHEGLYVDDKKHGRWVIRRPDGTSKVWEYRNGDLVP